MYKRVFHKNKVFRSSYYYEKKLFYNLQCAQKIFKKFF